MYNVETAQYIINRARKSLNRRIRDGKKARPVQDPLIELASEQGQRIVDLDDDNTRLAEQVELARVELEGRDIVINNVTASFKEKDAKIAELEALIAEFQRPIELIAD